MDCLVGLWHYAVGLGAELLFEPVCTNLKLRGIVVPLDQSMRYVRNARILAADLSADEKALLSAERGKYYGLNSPAARIWDLLAAPATLHELCDVLRSEFDVEAAECSRDTAELVAEMVAEGLLEEMPPGVG